MSHEPELTKEEARQALTGAESVRLNAAKKHSRVRAVYNFAAIATFFGTGAVLGDGTDDEIARTVMASCISVVVGVVLLYLNYRVPSRQHGWRASDTFISLLTISWVIATIVGAVVEAALSPTPGMWLLIYLLVLAASTYPVVRVGRHLTR